MILSSSLGRDRVIMGLIMDLWIIIAGHSLAYWLDLWVLKIPILKLLMHTDICLHSDMKTSNRNLYIMPKVSY